MMIPNGSMNALIGLSKCRPTTGAPPLETGLLPQSRRHRRCSNGCKDALWTSTAASKWVLISFGGPSKARRRRPRRSKRRAWGAPREKSRPSTTPDLSRRPMHSGDASRRRSKGMFDGNPWSHCAASSICIAEKICRTYRPRPDIHLRCAWPRRPLRSKSWHEDVNRCPSGNALARRTTRVASIGAGRTSPTANNSTHGQQFRPH